MKLLTKFLAILLFYLGSFCAMEKPIIPGSRQKKVESPVMRVKSREFPVKKPAEEQNTFLAEEEKIWMDKRSKFKNSTEELAAALLVQQKSAITKEDTSEDSSPVDSPEQLSPNHKLNGSEDY